MYRMNWKKNAVHTAEITGYTAEGMGVALSLIHIFGLTDRRTAAVHVCAGLGLAASGQQGEHQGRRQGSAESFHVYSSLHCVSAPALPWLKSRRG